MITAAKVFNESRIIVVYDEKGFMYSFKTYFVVVVGENGTQEETHCIYGMVYFFFPFSFVFMRMSLSDLESPMCISNHWEQQPQLQATELYKKKDAHICFASVTECASNITCAVLGKDSQAR